MDSIFTMEKNVGANLAKPLTHEQKVYKLYDPIQLPKYLQNLAFFFLIKTDCQNIGINT